ncbi:hypothetical protein B0T16DRAFT_366690, partial [Cercophora newfieldiana]
MEALAEAGLRAVALFDRVKAIDDSSETARRVKWQAARLAAELDRFQLWAVNLGLFVSGHASLDYRVRDAESIRATILRVMASLSDALTEVLDYFDESTAPPDQRDPRSLSLNDELDGAEEADSDDGADGDLLLDGIKDPIDRLFKLAVWIRNPSSRAVSERVLRYRCIDPETGVDLLDAFKERDRDFISSSFLEFRKSRALADHPVSEPVLVSDSDKSSDNVWEPIRSILIQHGAVGDSFLVHRLSRANTRRRQQFAYWIHHRAKLGQHTTTAMQQAQALNNSEIRATVPPATATIVVQGTADDALPIRTVTAVAQSVTTASRLDLLRVASWNDQATNASVSEYAASAWRPGKEDLGFPPPPKHLSDSKFFECPYCFTICSSALLSEKAWRAHLIHDLRPYQCTYEDCKSASQLYDSVESWIKHEESTHRLTMRCPEHPSRVFERQDEFENHLASEHSDRSDGVKTALLLSATDSTVSNANRCCPVCRATTLTSPKDLNSHIARHLERFALFALPRSAGDDGAEDNDSSKPDLSR